MEDKTYNKIIRTNFLQYKLLYLNLGSGITIITQHDELVYDRDITSPDLLGSQVNLLSSVFSKLINIHWIITGSQLY